MIYNADGEKVGAEEETQETRSGVPGLAVAFLCAVFVVIGGAAGEWYQQKIAKPPEVSWHSGSERTAQGFDYFTSASEQAALQKAREAEQLRKKKIWEERVYFPLPADIPDTIRIGPYKYQVKVTSEAALSSHNAWAESDLWRLIIYLSHDRTAQYRADLMHEILHCAKAAGTSQEWFSVSGGYGEEEDNIKAAAPIMAQVLRDNPKLVKFFTSGE